MKFSLSRIEKILVRQHGHADCGIACLLSIIRFHNGNGTLEILRGLSGTSVTGTTMLGLYQAAKACNFDAIGCELEIESLGRVEDPCILYVNSGSATHYVVFFGIDSIDGELVYLIGDPAKGCLYLNKQELEQIWLSRVCLTLSPNDKFQQMPHISGNKRKWVKGLLEEDFSPLFLASVLGIVIAILGLGMAVFSQRLIDDILPGRNFEKLNLSIGLLFIILLIKEGIAVLRNIMLLRQSRDFNIRIIDVFFNHLLRLPKVFFDTRKIGEFIARLNDTARIQRVISQLSSGIVIDVIVVFCCIVFIFVYSWQIGIMCLLGMPIYFYLIHRYDKRIRNAQRAMMNNYALVESNYVSTFQGIDPIKNHNKESLFSVVGNSVYRTYQDSILSLGRIQVGLSLLVNIFGIFFVLCILLFSGYQVFGGGLKGGELIAILSLCNFLLSGISNIALMTIPLNEAKIAFDRMYEFANLQKEGNGDDENDSISGDFNSLSVQNISFRFPGRALLLGDISFEVRKGDLVVLMGGNGSGKSTLAQILQKHYLIEQGCILFNENDFSRVRLNEWRRIVGVVPQNIHIFNASVLENISFEDAIVKKEEVIQFLLEYGFLNMLSTLPQSYMTLVGEEGINLSGGQKQIIALARALYQKPKFLILDEVTSAMDIYTEVFVAKLLGRMKAQMAILFITHRPGTIRKYCNKIYIIEEGLITHKGTHESLLQTVNIYSTYWKELILEH